jgi:hypothetical protein
MDHLDRHPSLQGDVGGQENDPHTPTTDLLLQPVLPAEGLLENAEEVGSCCGHRTCLTWL